jgi:site-specific recombinase XerD
LLMIPKDKGGQAMARTRRKSDEAPISIKNEISSRLPESHLELTQSMLDGYRRRLVGGSAQKSSTADRSIGIIQDFIAFTGKAPWLCSEGDYEAWGYNIGVVRQCVKETQRIYQVTLRDFYNYLIDNPLFSNLIRKLSGVSVRQVSFRHNSILHKNDNSGRLVRQAMSVADFNKMLGAIDDAIFDAMKFQSKALYPLIRDKVMFLLVVDNGLRSDEALGIDLCNFNDDPRLPEFGNYACVSVTGKGGKSRTVYLENPLLPPLLKFYVENVRPKLMKKNNPNEQAFFLSERGNRLGYSAFWMRFQNALGIANLDTTSKDTRLSPHSLRHSSVTNGMVEGRSVEANRLKHGHAFGSTTQGYGHVPCSFVTREIIGSIKNNQKRYEESLLQPK